MYIKGQPKLERALKKYGPENFKYEIIETTDKQEILDEKEKYYISFFNSMKNGYNCTPGGNTYKHSEESKRKCSMRTKEWLKTHTHNWLGKHHSEEAKKNMRIAQKGLKLGVKQSKETVTKRSFSMKKHYENMRQLGIKFLCGWPKGKKHKKSSIEKIINIKSQLWLVTSKDNISYTVKNLKAFCASKNINYSNLCSVARGNRKSCHGWKASKISKNI